MPDWFTSKAEVERLLGLHAVKSFLSDTKTGSIDPNVWADILDDATETVAMYLDRFYDRAQMAANKWVRRQATWLAAHYLTHRRGNPSLFNARARQVMDWLEMIRLGQLQVPGLAWKADLSPALSNMVVDDRFSIQKVRVQPTISTGGESARQHKDPVQGMELI